MASEKEAKRRGRRRPGGAGAGDNDWSSNRIVSYRTRTLSFFGHGRGSQTMGGVKANFLGVVPNSPRRHFQGMQSTQEHKLGFSGQARVKVTVVSFSLANGHCIDYVAMALCTCAYPSLNT